MSGVFLSYRRDDASGWAGRLYEHPVTEWGPGEVFMDIDAIAPGEDFRVAIAHTMEACDVVLVVIGPDWVDARDSKGNRRLDDEGDTHRQEVVAALSRAEVRVIPVLVGGADSTRPHAAPQNRYRVPAHRWRRRPCWRCWAAPWSWSGVWSCDRVGMTNCESFGPRRVWPSSC